MVFNYVISPVGAQNNSKLWLMFCIIIESNSLQTIFLSVIRINMAAMTSGENHLYTSLTQTPQTDYEPGPRGG